MFNIVSNYKNLFILFIKNDFGETPGGADTSELKKEDFGSDSLTNLKALKKSVSDGKITSNEADIIVESIGKIEGEAKQGLNEIINKILLQEGFSAMDKKTYDSFKALIESSESNYKIPTRDEVIQNVIDNTYNFSGVSLNENDSIINQLDRDDFHGITVKGDTIEVKYDGYGSDDTLNIKFNPINGKILTSEWDQGENEEVNVSGETKIDLSSMDDNISELKQERQRLADLEAQKLVDREQDTLSQKNIKEIKKQIKKIEDKISIIQLDIKTLKDNVVENKTNIEKNTKKISNLEKEILKINLSLTKLKENIAENKINTEENTENIKRLEEHISKINIDIQSIRDSLLVKKEDEAVLIEDEIEAISEDKVEEEVEAEIIPENQKKYEKANDWYKHHGGLENSKQIGDIQRVLVNEVGYDIATDGKFSKEFFNAVLKYQKDEGLKEDGLVGRETLDDMKMANYDTISDAREYYDVKEYNKAKKWYKDHGVDKNSSQIKEIQEALDLDFIPNGTVEGEFTVDLFKEITKTQKEFGLKEDGIAGAELLNHLGLISSKSNSKARAFYR